MIKNLRIEDYRTLLLLMNKKSALLTQISIERVKTQAEMSMIYLNGGMINASN